MKREFIKKKIFSRNQPNFIGNWNIDNDKVCNDIVNFFEKNVELQGPGITGIGEDFETKKSTDITIKPSDLKNEKYKCFNDYFAELHKCFTDYQDQWPFLKSMMREIDIGSFNIQKYSPGDHFAKYHSERMGLAESHRAFAWMTYLNDVGDGGSTAFRHYDIKIKPERGKTLIWPAEWTHAHAGEVLKSGVKYIITGWMHFA